MPQSTESQSAPRLPVTTGDLRHLIAAADTLIEVDGLKDSTRFADAGADSLDIFTLLLAVEEAYHLQIPNEDLTQVGTLEGLSRYLNRKLS